MTSSHDILTTNSSQSWTYQCNTIHLIWTNHPGISVLLQHPLAYTDTVGSHGVLKIPVLDSSRSPSSQGILNSSSFSCCLLLRLLIYMYLSQLMRTFTNYLKCIVIFILTFHFLILRMSECRNPTIKHISTYTLVSSSIITYVIDLFLGSNPYSKIPF